MTDEPTYPEDSPVGDPSASRGRDDKADSGRKRHFVTGAAIGVGSAALVAALLYANRSKKPAGKGPQAAPTQPSAKRSPDSND